MSSSNLSLVSENADGGPRDKLDFRGHYYNPVQHTVADRPQLHPPPSFYVNTASHMHFAAPSQGGTHDQLFAQTSIGAGKEPKSTADLSGPALLQMKLEGPDFYRRDEPSLRSDISSDQAVAAEVCSTHDAAAHIRFQPLRWALDSNQDAMRSQADPSTQSISNAVRLLAMAAGAENAPTPRENSCQDDMKTTKLAKVEREACYGYPQEKTAASMFKNVDFTRDYVQGSSNLDERSFNEAFAASGHPSAISVVNWFQPLSRSSTSIDHNLPRHFMRPPLHDNLQTTKSASHKHEYNSPRPASRAQLLQQYSSSIINEGGYGGEEDLKSSYQESLAFHPHRFSSDEHDEDGLRINGSERLAHIPVSMLMQGVHQQVAGARSAEWDDGNLTSIANAATKELLLLNRVQAASSTGREIISNDNILPQCSSGTAYDAENTGDVDMDTQELLHRSSLHDHYNVLAALSSASTQQLGNQVVAAAGGPQLDTVASTNPNMPLALSWDHESYCKVDNHNLLPTSFMMQQAQPVKSGAISSTTSGNSVLINHSGLFSAAAFSARSHQRAPLLPNKSVAGSLSRYIPAEDLSLRRPSSDFLSLDCTYSRSGSMSLIRTSKYLKPAQQLLEEFCNLKPDYSTKGPYYAVIKSKEAHEAFDRRSASAKQDVQLSAEERCHVQMKKTRFIGMVEELDRRYQQYHDQTQLIVTSFESATGMGAAVPYTALARKLISRQFRALRDAIGEHIQIACRTLGEDISDVPVLNKGETPRLRILDQRLRHHRTLQQVGMLQQHQGWRPQRGLPERSVTVLRAWLFEHFLHPYPKDSEKLMLARLTGLTRSQVANWFINARVRLWKPMVEQMYEEESKEVESQDAVEASTAAQYGQQDKVDIYAWSGGHIGNGVTMQAEHVNGASSNHFCQKSQHLSHESSDGTMSHNGMATRHGVSLTLGLQYSSSLELPSSSYNPDHHFSLQSAPARDVNYLFV